MNRDLDPRLQRAGVRQITSNLQPGQQVIAPPGYIFAYFGDEIMEALRQRAQRHECKMSK